MKVRISRQKLLNDMEYRCDIDKTNNRKFYAWKYGNGQFFTDGMRMYGDYENKYDYRFTKPSDKIKFDTFDNLINPKLQDYRLLCEIDKSDFDEYFSNHKRTNHGVTPYKFGKDKRIIMSVNPWYLLDAIKWVGNGYVFHKDSRSPLYLFSLDYKQMVCLLPMINIDTSYNPDYILELSMSRIHAFHILWKIKKINPIFISELYEATKHKIDSPYIRKWFHLCNRFNLHNIHIWTNSKDYDFGESEKHIKFLNMMLGKLV